MYSEKLYFKGVDDCNLLIAIMVAVSCAIHHVEIKIHQCLHLANFYRGYSSSEQVNSIKLLFL